MKTMEEKSSKILFVLAIILLGMIMSVSNLSYTQSVYAQSTEHNIAYYDDMNPMFVNTNIKNKRNEMIAYVSENKYGQNTPLSGNNNRTMTINDNDEIIDYVPEELFKTINQTQHIGEQYGFFIDTRKPFEDNDMLLSTVILIDVNNNNELGNPENKSFLSIKLTPVFQAEFAYIERGNNVIYNLKQQNYDFFKDEYEKDLNVVYNNANNGFIVPIPTESSILELNALEFCQHNKYYITNTSNQTSLYNKNYLNIGDEGYNANDDMGAFFSMLDFNYDGIFLQEGSTSISQVGDVTFSAASFAADIESISNINALKSVTKTISTVSKIMAIADIALGMYEISESLKTEIITDEKTISYTPLYNSKQLQIANGGLMRDAVISAQSKTNKKLFFGTDSYFEFNYQIHSQDINVDMEFATMINLEFVSITNTSQWNTTFGEGIEKSSSYIKKLDSHTDENYKETPMIELADILTNRGQTVLPNSPSYIELDVLYSGDYVIDVDNSNAEFIIYKAVYDELGYIVHDTDSERVQLKENEKYNLSSLENYVIEIYFNDYINSDGVLGSYYGVVDLSIEFSPNEIDFGDVIELNNILPGDTQYVVFNAQNDVGFNYSINAMQDFISGTYYEEMYNHIGNTSYAMDFNNKNAVVTNNDGKYYISIKNDSEQVKSNTITLSSPVELEICDQYILNVGYNALYKIPKTKANVPMLFSLYAQNSTKMQLYNESLEMVRSAQGVGEFSFTNIQQQNSQYYILLSNANYNMIDVAFTMLENMDELSLGNNRKQYENGESNVYSFTINETAEYKITSILLLEVYNSSWQKLEPLNGYYEFEKSTTERLCTYFVVVKYPMSSFDITLSINYTDDISGILNSNGYRYIKFQPIFEDDYIVKNISDYLILDSNLNQVSGNLYTNQTYYVKISGGANTSFNIQILRNAIEIFERTNLGCNSKLYYVDIEDAGVYSLSFEANNNTKASYKIYNATNSSNIQSISNEVGKYFEHFSVGINYIEIFTDKEIGLIINSLHSDNDDNNATIVYDTNQSLILSNNSDNEYVYTCGVSGDNNLKIAYSYIIELDFDIIVTDSEFNIVETEMLTSDFFANDNLSKRYSVNMINLVENETYYINIYYQSNISNLQTAVLISGSSKITDVNLHDGNKTLTILDGRERVSGINLVMGKTYTISTPNANNTGWKIADSVPESIAEINDNQLTILFDKLNVDEEIHLLFADDTNENLTVSMKIIFPYKASHSYNIDKLEYTVELVDEYNSSVSSSYINSIDLNVGSKKLSVNDSSCVLTAYIKDNFKTISSSVNIDFGENTYSLDMDPINVTRTNYNLQAMGNTETIQSSGQVVIDARIGNPSNKTITVSSNTTSLIYLGSTSTLTNIKFIFNSRNAFYLYLVDYKVESTGENRVLDMAKIDYSNIYIEGTNIIKGKAYENNVPTYLMEADKIEFFGNGKLNITGYNGANGISRGTATSGNDGSDGTNGENGFGALDCNRINNDTVIINLQGGKGGAGGKGGNGQSASSSNNLIDGTLGGNGGDGGDAGKGCSISTSGIFGVTDNDGFAGLGGNGGNGGDGKDGIDARVWASINHVSYVINKSEATKGGNGGNGGLAGLNGSGDVDPNTSYNQYPKGGIGGKGGDGGDGFGGEVETGEISNPQSIYFSLEANDGGDGGDGGNGYNGGDGGDGGKGGTGSTGDGGTIFVSGKQGGTGGDGGDGGDGGNSTISGDDLSSGGGAGGAGSGGDGGDSLLGKDGAKGQNGEPGEPGAPGEYTPPPEPSCVALGTLITLANGTQVAVEDLIGNEQLLVWNMLTGEFDSAPILFIDSEARARYNIVRLKFSDGTKVDVIDEHGFYNMTLNKYVFLDENAEQYIGHYFNKQSIDENGKMVWESVQLKKVKHISKKTSAWSPVTYSHLCYYVNGMLSMPGGTTSLINIFDVEADTMTIDMESYNADIAEYGLFTYEEFAEIMPVSEYVFDAFNAQYFKVAMGKGILTWDDLATLFETYQDFLI